jgi:hypothetical protein
VFLTLVTTLATLPVQRASASSASDCIATAVDFELAFAESIHAAYRSRYTLLKYA